MNAQDLYSVQPEELVPMDLFERDFPLRCEMVYADGHHPRNIFGRIYRQGAKLWLHRDLARIVLLACRYAHQRHGLHTVLYDGLRTCEAQALMQQSPIAQANPHWLEGPNRMLSPPGTGAHPRGMAIDLSLETAEGELLDMGTPFDHLAENPLPAFNPSHRDYEGHNQVIMDNRRKLTDSMVEAALALDLRLLPLPVEWWDFRLPPALSNQFAALRDADLPPAMRMTDTASASPVPDLPDDHFDALKKEIIGSL